MEELKKTTKQLVYMPGFIDEGEKCMLPCPHNLKILLSY
jgi:hypothetical protein